MPDLISGSAAYFDERKVLPSSCGGSVRIDGSVRIILGSEVPALSGDDVDAVPVLKRPPILVIQDKSFKNSCR